MNTTLDRIWQVALPEALLQTAGFREGEPLECRAFPGMLCLTSEGAAFAAPSIEKKISRI